MGVPMSTGYQNKVDEHCRRAAQSKYDAPCVLTKSELLSPFDMMWWTFARFSSKPCARAGRISMTFSVLMPVIFPKATPWKVATNE
mmetsp:Transcript_106652/g.188681  ORF Transcript_106652/g.188681 Transcript_106652/m.188681 type:complete len:86 (-) Transcript_106652:299-556(-)